MNGVGSLIQSRWGSRLASRYGRLSLLTRLEFNSAYDAGKDWWIGNTGTVVKLWNGTSWLVVTTT